MGLSVYIIECSDNTYYTGVTNNVNRRFSEHCDGLDPKAYTYSRRPLKLVWQNYFEGNLEAIGWEKRIKRWSSEKKRALINGQFDLLKELSACRNQSHFNNRKL